MKRRAEVEKLARERAKVKAQREEQERASRAVAGVNHLEIPAELAFIFSKLDGKYCFHVHIAQTLHVTLTGPSKSKGVSNALTLQPYMAC